MVWEVLQGFDISRNVRGIIVALELHVPMQASAVPLACSRLTDRQLCKHLGGQIHHCSFYCSTTSTEVASTQIVTCNPS